METVFSLEVCEKVEQIREIIFIHFSCKSYFNGKDSRLDLTDLNNYSFYSFFVQRFI